MYKTIAMALDIVDLLLIVRYIITSFIIYFEQKNPLGKDLPYQYVSDSPDYIKIGRICNG